jgi:hypothetical protein
VESLELTVERQARLLGVAYALRTAGVVLCGEAAAPILGIAVLRNEPGWSPTVSDAFERRFGAARNEIAIVAVHPDSPGDRAGLQRGDVVVGVGGRPVYTRVELFERAREAREAVVLSVARGELSVDIEVERRVACWHEAFIEVADWMLTDVARDGHFYVTSGFVRFARSDDELALVVSHELAHRLDSPSTIPGPEGEVRADLLGLHLAALAGYDISIAPDFWDRVAIEQPWTLSDDVEHYGFRRVPPHAYMPTRAAAIRHIVEAMRIDPELALEWLAAEQR